MQNKSHHHVHESRTFSKRLTWCKMTFTPNSRAFTKRRHELIHGHCPQTLTTRIVRKLYPSWINVSSLSPELRVLTIIMFHNLYPLSSTGYINLGRALFLHDLISDVEIDICDHIFHILRKTVVRTNSRICIPFCYLISWILKLKGIYPLADESSHPKPCPINLWTLNASIGHSKKGVKSESQP